MIVVEPPRARDDFYIAERQALQHLPRWLPPPQAWEQRLFGSRNVMAATARLFVAYDGDDVRGRIAAWPDATDPTLGVFGWFDAVDRTAGRHLVERAKASLAERGAERIRGPIDFWTLISAGVPVDGLDRPNTFALHHGAEHYHQAIEAAGLKPVAHIHSWQFGDRPIPPPAKGIARATLADPALRLVDFEPGNREHWEVAAELYAKSYVGGWFRPMTRQDLRLIADDYVEPHVSFLAFVRGTPAGMSIALRNMVESSVRLGDMIPPEGVQRMLRPARPPQNFRQWLFAVAPQFRGSALGHLSTAMYVTIREKAEAAGLGRGEAAWTQSVDKRNNAALATVGARRDKTYRLYESRL